MGKTDQVIGDLASIGRAKSMFSLVVSIFIAVVFFIFALVALFQKNWGGGFIMLGVSLLIGGVSYIIYHFTTKSETFAALQGASAVSDLFRGK